MHHYSSRFITLRKLRIYTFFKYVYLIFMSYYLSPDFLLCLIYYDVVNFTIFLGLFYFINCFLHLMIMRKERQRKSLAPFNNFKNSKLITDLIKFIKTSYINKFSCSLPINYLKIKGFDFIYFTLNFQLIALSTHF